MARTKPEIIMSLGGEDVKNVKIFLTTYSDKNSWKMFAALNVLYGRGSILYCFPIYFRTRKHLQGIHVK